MRYLPPLNPLRAFESAAAHQSFTRAARALHVTPAAVSQQVRLLEEWLGLPLFHRTHRALSLTAAGQAYLPEVRTSLERLSDATESLLSTDNQGANLTVGAMASFASRWLLPRLGRFYAEHPDIEISLSTSHNLVDSELEDSSERLIDFDQRAADVTLRYGRGHWPGFESVELVRDEVFPVCSPALMAGPNALRTPADLVHHRLLHDVLPEDWSMWLNATGVHSVDGTRGPTFSHSHDMLQAAALGQGVALGRTALVEGDLKAGRLVRPYVESIPGAFSYFFVSQASVTARPKVQAFRAWLCREAQMSDASAPPPTGL